MSKIETAINPKANFIKKFNSLCYGVERWNVFSDFLEMSAISLRQPFYRDAEAGKGTHSKRNQRMKG